MKSQRIHKLDEITASKIAAGEVVEKPATVIKELVENSIDAGSKRIHVLIEKGGKKRMQVIDNGSGIVREDLTLVFERHATSKINAIEDLYETNSLGFRGEALASISAVSEVELITRTADDQVGTKAIARGGKIVSVTEIGALVGTSITVQNLFYNTPARLKFLKSDQAETKHISELMSHLALSHPEIAFEYTQDGKTIFQTPGDHKLKNAIYEIYDREMIKNLFEVEHEAMGIKVTGYASTFAYTKGNSTYQTTFINGRFIKSDLIKEAITLAYKPYLMHGRFPVGFLFFEISPREIDVNIHPAKTEIKFHQEGDVKQVVYSALRKAFNLQNQTPSVTFTEKEIFNVSKWEKPITESIFLESYSKAEPLMDEQPQMETPKVETPKVETLKPSLLDEKPLNTGEKPITYPEIEPVKTQVNESQPFVMRKIEDNTQIDFSNFDLSPLTQFADEVESFNRPIETTSIYDDLNYVGTFLNTYLIFQKADSMYLVDQHAGHEKIIYEQMMKGFKDGSVDTQLLLLPEMINYGVTQQSNLPALLEQFKNFGFDIDDFGPKTLAIRGIPNFMPLNIAIQLITEIMDGLSQSVDEHINEKLMSKACKAAIKAYDSLDHYEVKALLESLRNLEAPYTCPHGRPIIIEISKHELERKFKRIV